jgi:hypothetical protein
MLWQSLRHLFCSAVGLSTTQIMKYRMYIDEVGNASMTASPDPSNRYLSLTGIIMGLDYVDDVVASEMESLKRRYFSYGVINGYGRKLLP